VRILVTGAHGQLGRELLAVLSNSAHEVIGVGHADCDVTSAGSVARVMAATRPDSVINCAAWTGVDAAETHRDAAYAVNATGADLLARECDRRGALLCHMSTDYVFDGAATAPYPEDAPVHPLGVYGASKAAGEAAVRTVSPRHQIVRTAWLYGQDGPNFVLTMLRLARERGELRVVADQRGTPTWTGHLAPALARLVELGVTGTFHLTNGGDTTWHGFARAIVDDASLDAPVAAISTADYPTPAPRPRYAVLGNDAWLRLGQAPLPPWRDGLREYLRQRSASR
jgi:dTDP-4-dehydrorhamnose reductase